MKRIALALLPTLALVSTPASAQTPNLAGAWTLVSNDVEDAQGKFTPAYGEKPAGHLIMTSDGHVIAMTIRSDLPKFKSGGRISGTPEENKAVVQGSLAYYGTYKVEGRNIVYHLDKATFPNWDGQEQRRPFTLNGDKLELRTAASAGNGTLRVIWQRVAP